jgi:ferredoxin
MAQRRLSRQELLSWLDGLIAEQRVFAPVRDEEGMAFLQPVASSAEVDLSYGQTVNSIKEFFFPATETLLKIRRGKRTAHLEVPDLEDPQVLFAVRPCDAAALSSMDALFLGDPADLYYGARRRNRTIVGLACLEVPTPACFCTTTGGSPIGTANLDVILYEAGDGYVVEALSEKGQALLDKAGGEALEEKLVPSAPELPSYPCPPEEEWLRIFDDVYWERLGERCLGCKICTYNCPTCYCFDIRDRGTGGRVERLRAWDACQSKHFYVEASGHDPRPSRGLHLRNRFYHKYYYFPWRYEGILLCSGCGRCVTQCPVNIDLTEVLDQVHTRASALAS